MKTPLFIRLSMAVIAATLLVQCSSTPKTRIEKNPQMFANLSAADRQIVSSGHIREGMGRDAVFLAWGRPDSVSIGTNRGRESEVWNYEGQRPIRSMSTSMGFGYGGFGYGGWGPYGYGGLGGYPMMGTGTSVTYMPYNAGEVGFVAGRVVNWKATKR